MSAFPVSDLLNPEQNAVSDSSIPTKSNMEDESEQAASSQMFAPELFAGNLAADAVQPSAEDTTMHDIEPSGTVEPIALADDRKGSVDSEAFAEITNLEDDPTDEFGKKHGRSTKQRDPDKLKDTRHSSKNEGQHTDRRYLCYICHKLFTRRRSVRDHLNKIHGEKTWEPTKSLEIEVEPHSGEPIESIEVLIARGPPPPPAKPEKAPRQPRIPDVVDEEEEEDEKKESIPQQPPDIPRLKAESSAPESRPGSVEPSQTPQPAPIIGKKRPLPAKKGTAKLKTTPNKRPRLIESESSTPARSPSVTPATKGSRLKKISESPVPSSQASSRESSPSPTPSVATPASSNDDGEIFCICRKGDNHTWMIACDGGCEEWFHGKCVNIRERDGDLIDKYICPNCTRDGFITTWKRMCRRKGCRKPAKVCNDPPSKYCSQACGRMFFVDLINRGDPVTEISKNGQYVLAQQKPKKMKKKARHDARKTKGSGHATPMMEGSRAHTPAYSDDDRSEYETDSSLDDYDLPNRGGALRAGEVKAILEKCTTVDEWRMLGKKPATPPQEDGVNETIELEYDEYEKDRLTTIKQSLGELQERMEILAAREKLLDLIKARSGNITEEVKKGNPKQKELCGYDPRIGWSEEEFVQWWKAGGKQVLEAGKIGPPGDDIMVNGSEDGSDGEERRTTTKGGVCVRNRCPKHGGTKWQRGQLAEVRFEQDLIRRTTERLEQQQREIRDRAMVRSWEKR